MNRRTFLKGTAFAALSTAFPWSGASGDTAMLARAERFEQAMQARPWLLGYSSVVADQFKAGPDEIHVEGKIPAALSGTFYRNGPGGHEVAGQRYAHWFDGDGLLHAFHLHDGRVRHRGRLLATPKRLQEVEAGRPLYDGFGTRVAERLPIRGPDELNPANINVLSHGGDLMALWEGGSPARLDPETLEFQEFVAFSPETSGMPFSAHTRTDPDGTLWSIGYAGFAGKVILYRIGRDGRLANLNLLDIAPTPMLHDFMVTRRHLVLIMPPWKYDSAAGDTFLTQHVWRPEDGTRALIIDKNDLAVTQEIDLPGFWSFHYANAWEDRDGRIHFDFPRYEDPSQTSEGFADVMDGEWPRGTDPRYFAATLDTRSGRYEETAVIPGLAAEFPRILPEQTGARHDRTLLCFAGGRPDALHPGFDGTGLFNPKSGQLDRFVHHPHEMAEEAVFAQGDDGSAWVLQTVLDFKGRVTRLKIFRADDLSGGPVAIATLPYALPLGLHGLYVT